MEKMLIALVIELVIRELFALKEWVSVGAFGFSGMRMRLIHPFVCTSPTPYSENLRQNRPGMDLHCCLRFPHPTRGKSFGMILLRFALKFNMPWLLVKLFNDTTNMKERTGCSAGLAHGCTRFANCIVDLKLVDMDFIGPRFTWHRKNVLT